MKYTQQNTQYLLHVTKKNYELQISPLLVVKKSCNFGAT